MEIFLLEIYVTNGFDACNLFKIHDTRYNVRYTEDIRIYFSYICTMYSIL